MREIFVFGSNLAGRHGAGAALEAVEKHGAVKGVGVGMQGDSYAIPTKDKYLKTLPLSEVQKYVGDFKAWAKEHPELQFNITRVGCGLAGYFDRDIAPFFSGSSNNCILPEIWTQFLRLRAEWDSAHGKLIPSTVIDRWLRTFLTAEDAKDWRSDFLLWGLKERLFPNVAVNRLRHELKCWPVSFIPMLARIKKFDLRKNDRDFKIGDVIRQREWDPCVSAYTGREFSTEVTWILYEGFGLPEGYCILSLSGIFNVREGRKKR